MKNNKCLNKIAVLFIEKKESQETLSFDSFSVGRFNIFILYAAIAICKFLLNFISYSIPIVIFVLITAISIIVYNEIYYRKNSIRLTGYYSKRINPKKIRRNKLVLRLIIVLVLIVTIVLILK